MSITIEKQDLALFVAGQNVGVWLEDESSMVYAPAGERHELFVGATPAGNSRRRRVVAHTLTFTIARDPAAMAVMSAVMNAQKLSGGGNVTVSFGRVSSGESTVGQGVVEPPTSDYDAIGQEWVIKMWDPPHDPRGIAARPVIETVEV